MTDTSPPDGPLTPRALAPHVPPLARSVIALCAGLFVGGLMIMFFVRIGHFVVAPPQLPANTASPADSLAAMRPANFVVLLFAYLAGGTLGCWMAARMARRSPLHHAAIVAGVFLLGVGSSFLRMPYPAWFVIGAAAAFVAAPFMGSRMAGR